MFHEICKTSAYAKYDIKQAGSDLVWKFMIQNLVKHDLTCDIFLL